MKNNTILKRKVILIFIIVLAISTNAQNLDFEIISKNLNSFTAQTKGGVAFGDLNGDGKPDLVVTGELNSTTRRTIIYENVGRNQFQEKATSNIENLSEGEVVIFDMDGDGDNDLFISGKRFNNSFGQSDFYRNDGNFNFIYQLNPSFNSLTEKAATLDVDNDGDLDLFTLVSGFCYLQINDGAGNFAQSNTFPIPRVDNGDASFADVDGDGDLDFIAQGENSSGRANTYYFKNNGTGIFVQTINQPFGAYEEGEVEFIDFENDGDQDVYLAGNDGRGNYFTKFYTNDGTGNYMEANLSGPFVGDDEKLQILDINNDGLDDYVITSHTSLSSSSRIYLNNGSGGSDSIINVRSGRNRNMAFGDTDGDGDLDAFSINGSTISNTISELLINDGSGLLSLVTPDFFTFNVSNSASASADIDGDGDIDLYLSGLTGTTVESAFFFNDGAGNFTSVSASNVSSARGVAEFHDFDGDGDMDLISCGGLGLRLFLNDGNGNFTNSNFFNPNDGFSDGSIGVGDFDEDGDLDIVAMGNGFTLFDQYNNSKVRQYTNNINSNNTFILKQNTSFPQVSNGDIEIADFDGDGHLDMILSGATGRTQSSTFRTRFYYGDGNGNLTFDNTLPLPEVADGAIALGDIDNDGDLDLFLSGSNERTSNVVTAIFKNAGGRAYTFFTSFAAMNFYYDENEAEFTDMNQDGKLDLVIFGDRSISESMDIWLQSSNGTFVRDISNNFEGSRSGSLEIADFTGDSYPEMVVTGFQNSTKRKIVYYINKSCLTSEVLDSNSYLVAVQDSASYEWFNCDSNKVVVGETGKRLYPSKDGNYAAIISKGVCRDTSDCISVIGVGIQEVNASEFKLYPNPNNGQFTIELKNPTDFNQLELIDIRGRVVKEISLIAKQKFAIEMNLKSGIYVVRLIGKKSTTNKRIVIE